jgi:hypothetical protein
MIKKLNKMIKITWWMKSCMKLYKLLYLCLFITPSVWAMVGGVENPAVQTAFEEALKAGTREAIEQCIRDHSITFNTRCIEYQLTPRGTDYRWAYPLEYAIKYYGHSSEEGFKKRIELLLDLGAPMNEYEDYNPLIHVINGSGDAGKIRILLVLRADPSKQISYNKGSITALQCVEEKITANKSTELNTLTSTLNYQGIQTLLLNPPAVEKRVGQPGAPVPAKNASGVSPLFKKLKDEVTATYWHMMVVAIVAFSAGVGCTKLFEWYMHADRDASDDQKDETEEISEIGKQEKS